ncbi:SAF domain-containing protein [Pyxidicoccus xibeiensis]|uniref:SAF domain-containing protein n=1 Tax=Pyxidicoccus xibeiensis TaxID=2906759 RepID=UPI0020A802FC|nr:SAF domain-containing protein [Pyxidicoccus xibeiensis]MCP3144131.1 SAF domain-containing protein [Pyxidicoccus xibeiensis]
MNAPRAPQQGSGFFPGAVIGGVLGFLVMALVLGVGGYAYVKKRANDARRGWNLVPVVVAAQDMPEDTLVTFEGLSQRSVPEQFVTTSVVKPDSASYIVNQRLNVSVQAGDPMLWTHFDTKKRAPFLVAARDIPVGAKLTEADMVPKGLDSELVTPSYVKESERPQVVGRPVIAAFRKGDPILWTHFRNEPPPVTGATAP